MTPHSAAEIDRITRCALCKIDLKGRFVFIDDRTETLLGYSKEELFGKTFKEFLSEGDHEIFFHVMRQQRTFETAFDSIPVTLQSRTGQSMPATIVVTLGFIAGNPVNYQIIIQTSQSERQAVSAVDESPSYHRFISTVLSMNGSLSLPDVLEPMREFIEAQAVGLYKINDGKLELSASAPRDTQIPTTIDVQRIPSLLKRLADVVAEPGLTLDQIQRGFVETSSDTVAEYFCEFDCADHKYLLRATFEPGNTELADSIALRATLALKLVLRLLKHHEPASEIVIPEYDFGVGLALFDSLSVGAMFVRSDGSIAAANHTLAKICKGRRPEGRIDDVIRLIESWGCPNSARNLATFFDSAVANPPLSWKETVTLPGGVTAQLTAIRHSVSQSDSSAWFLIIPATAKPTGSNSSADVNIAKAAVDDILSSLSAANTISDRLTHEFYDELHRDGNLYLSLLNGHMDKLRGMVSELGHLMRAWLAPEEISACDLNLIVAGAVQEISSTYPEVVVNCKFSNLPKLYTHRHRLSQLVHNLLSNSVKFSRGGKVDIQIATQIANNKCTLTISDSGPGIPAKYLEKVFDLYYRVPLHPWQKLPGDGSSLAITRHLARAMGGTLTLTSEEGKGTQAIVDLPNLAPEAPQAAAR